MSPLDPPTRAWVRRLGALALGALLARAGRAAPAASLAALLDEALTRNPSLLAAQATRRAHERRRPQVTSLPDPRLNLGVFLESVETRVGPQRQSLGLSQMIPAGGKRSILGSIADRGVEVADQEVVAVRLDVTSRLRKAYYEYWFTRRSREITREVMELVVSGERVARTRYAAGRAGQEVILRAQVELGVLEDRIQTLDELEPTHVEAINALLDRDPGTPLGDPASEDLVETEVLLPLEELQQAAGELSPQVRALLVKAEQKSLERKLAAKATVPDLTLGVNWVRTGAAPSSTTLDSGKDPILATLSINLPLHTSAYRAREREREEERTALLRAADATVNQLEAALKAAHFRYTDGRRKLSLYRDSLVPKGRQALEASFASFQAGRASFLDLLDAERILLDFELSHARAMAEHLGAIAEIERLVARQVSRKVPAP